MKMGLVLEGGALRGLFTAGVLDVLMENNIKFDGVIGVSAGACFGCNYLSKQIGRVIRYNLKLAKNKRYWSFSSRLKTGDLFESEFCYHELPEKIDVFDWDEFNKSEVEFYVVASDVLTGKPVYHQIKEINSDEMEWIRASASMPLMANIVNIDGGKYLDGGVTDSIPVKAFRNMGYDINVTVLTKPRGYRKKPNKLMWLIKKVYRNYPSFIHANEVRHVYYNEQLADVFEYEREGLNFVICPKSPLPIGHVTHDPLKMKEAYELGRSEALEQLPALLRFIESHNIHVEKEDTNDGNDDNDDIYDMKAIDAELEKSLDNLISSKL